MGRPKMLLPWDSSTILETVVWKALSSRSDGVLVVLGADKNKTKRLIKRAPVTRIYNKNHKKGMLSSVRAGMTALPAGTGAAIFALGDQPHIRADVFDLLIDSFHASAKGIILPTFRGKRGHPLLVDMKFREEILGLDDFAGLRGLLEAHPHEILEVPMDDPGILKDIDSPEEYQSLLSESKSGPSPGDEEGD
jgi:molybdenum cofactor cytidylyltransferase